MACPLRVDFVAEIGTQPPRGDWWWPGDQLGKPAKVLRNRGQRELELGTAWSAQSQPAEPQNSFKCANSISTRFLSRLDCLNASVYKICQIQTWASYSITSSEHLSL
jgi:hypothetical protein